MLLAKDIHIWVDWTGLTIFKHLLPALSNHLLYSSKLSLILYRVANFLFLK